MPLTTPSPFPSPKAGGENVFMSELRYSLMKIFIEIQSQNGGWQPYSTCNHQTSAYNRASSLSKKKGKRFRMVDDNKRILDTITP